MTLFMIGYMALKVLGFAFLVLLAVRIAMGFRGRHDGALAALERRLVAGEISPEEFAKMKAVLEA